MLKTFEIAIDEIYVPTKFRKTLDENKVQEIAESVMEIGQTTPKQVRKGKGRFVLISGLHRLEALRALGEEKIQSLIVSAQKY